MEHLKRITGIKIFYSLLILSLLETVVWSFCLFPCCASVASTEVAQAYYARETVNLKSTTGSTPHYFQPVIDTRGLELALKEEAVWRQRAFSRLFEKSSIPSPHQAERTSLASCRFLFSRAGGSATSSSNNQISDADATAELVLQF